MAILNTGLARERDLISADISSGVAGTGTTAIAFTQTSLVSEDSSVTDSTPTNELSEQTIVINTSISPAAGNGNTYTEWGIKGNSDSTLYTRTLSAGVIKNSSIEVNRVDTWYFDRE